MSCARLLCVTGAVERGPESEWIRLTIPPILDAETFHAAQAALQQHRAIATRNRKHAYLLCGGR